MALIVETGAGLVDAESYMSVAEADTYHTVMNNPLWTGSGAVKEAALRKATNYLDASYRYRGERIQFHQRLEWPRIDGTHQWRWDWPVRRLKDACAELAMRALSEDLYLDTTDGAVKQETVGPITIVYDSQIRDGQKHYAIVDALLQPLAGGSTSMRLERA